MPVVQIISKRIHGKQFIQSEVQLPQDICADHGAMWRALMLLLAHYMAQATSITERTWCPPHQRVYIILYGQQSRKDVRVVFQIQENRFGRFLLNPFYGTTNTSTLLCYYTHSSQLLAGSSENWCCQYSGHQFKSPIVWLGMSVRIGSVHPSKGAKLCIRRKLCTCQAFPIQVKSSSSGSIASLLHGILLAASRKH